MEIATGLKDSLVPCTTFPTLTLLRIFEFFPRVFFSASLYAFSRPRKPTLFPRLRSVLQHFCFSPPSHHPPAAVKEGGGGACRRRNFFGLSSSVAGFTWGGKTQRRRPPLPPPPTPNVNYCCPTASRCVCTLGLCFIFTRRAYATIATDCTSFSTGKLEATDEEGREKRRDLLPLLPLSLSLWAEEGEGAHTHPRHMRGGRLECASL